STEPPRPTGSGGSGPSSCRSRWRSPPSSSPDPPSAPSSDGAALPRPTPPSRPRGRRRSRKEQPMPPIKPPRPLTIPAGLAALGSGARADTSGGSVAPVENGASQVKITLTGDDGGTCILDHGTAKAGPITFAVTNRTATAISEVELQSDNRI